MMHRVVADHVSFRFHALNDLRIFLDKITYDEIYNKGLKVMDLTATTMCKENNLPIVVFNIDVEGNLKKLMQGEPIGTLVY